MHNKSPSNSVAGFVGVNLACGGKLCRMTGWINADQSPSTKEVLKINLLKSLPFPENTFDVVYHSQFIEHLPYESAVNFMRECYRILKPNGVLRIVTPDLHNQAVEYLRNLQAVLNFPNDEGAKLRYDWIRLEMLDQLTRNTSGGDMLTFLRLSAFDIREYLWHRMGRSGQNLIPNSKVSINEMSLKNLLKNIRQYTFVISNKIIPKSLSVGRFRLSGESHLCMYDEYFLSMLFAKAGFENITRVNAKQSRITDWDMTQLDCDAQGNPDSQASLFMEAVKPSIN